jgi:Sulfotransferase family
LTLIDHVKRLRSATVDRLHPQRVVFHHVPKCGGTSVGRALRKRYLLSQGTVSPESSYKALEAFTGSHDREALLIDVLDFREQMLLYHLFEDVHCISAHVRFSVPAYERFRSTYKFITILRDPVSRFLSHYTWSYGKPDAHARIEEPFGEFLKTERAKRLGATYVEFFSGLPKSADIRSEEAIEAAVANLARFDIVGRLDSLVAFESSLAEILGVRLKIGHENKATRRTAASEAMDDPQLKAEVLALCAPDIAVWERHAAQGSDTGAAVAV